MPPRPRLALGILALLVLAALGGAPRAAAAAGGGEDAITAAAIAEFKLGREAYDDGRYEEALRHFEKAQAIKYSPKLHFNIGLVYQRMAEPEKAIEAYKRYLKEEPNAKNAPEARKRIRIQEIQVRVKQERDGTAPPASAPAEEAKPKEEERPSGPPLLRPGTHRAFAAAALGGGFGLTGSSHFFKIVEAIGVHFRGEAGGPGLSLEIHEALASGLFLLEAGPRFAWDIRVGERGLYISPGLMAGFVYFKSDFNFPEYNPAGSSLGFGLQAGVDLKLVLGDRGLLLLRPVSISYARTYSSDLSVWQDRVRFDVLLGGGVTF
jgi:tetratricopeptide (TPR) repeat protein